MFREEEVVGPAREPLFEAVHTISLVDKFCFGFVEVLDPGALVALVQLPGGKEFQFRVLDAVEVLLTVATLVEDNHRTFTQAVFYLAECIVEVDLIVHVAPANRDADGYIDRAGKLADICCNLLLVGPVIATIAVLAQRALVAIQNEARLVHVGMFEIVHLEQHIPDVRDDLLPVLADNLKDPIEGLLLKRLKIEGVQYLLAVDPISTSRNALVLCELIAQKGLNEGVDVPTSFLVLPEYRG